VRIDWDADPPVITARVSVSDPRLPTFTQVSAVQSFINTKLAPRQFRLVVKRTSIDVVGPEPEPVPDGYANPAWPWLTPAIVPQGGLFGEAGENPDDDPAAPDAADAPSGDGP
jgi:hypothetical protein